jgi:DEAD/DEAH box helicase domain-containing protein
LNVGSRTAVVRLADVKYFTGTVDMTTVTLVQHGAQTHAYPHRPGPTHRPAQFDGTTAQCAECEIRVAFSAYHKIWQGTGQVFDTVGLSLPDVVYRTRAAWIRVPDAARRECDNLGLDFRAGVHAATHAVINALPLFLMVNQSDCGAECDDPQRKHYKPTRVLIFDRQPGGVGIAERAAPMFPKLLRAAAELIEECRDCRGEDEAEGGGDGDKAEGGGDGNGDGKPKTSASLSTPAGDRSGCPGCVHYLACDVYNVALDRAAALVVLRSIMDAEETTFGAHQCEADDGGGGFDFAAGSDLDRCACCANGRHGKKTRGGV